MSAKRTDGRFRRWVGVFLSGLVIAVACSSGFRVAFSFPDVLTLQKGQILSVDTGFPVVSVYSSSAQTVHNHSLGNIPVKVLMDTDTTGEYRLEFRLFGILPLRSVSLVVKDTLMVVPGGHSIGVILRSNGLLVTGLASVEALDGGRYWPAKDAGVEVGDVILSVEDRKVSTKDRLVVEINEAGRQGKWLDILVQKPDGSVQRKIIWPLQHKNGGFNAGVFVKDSLAGVGTLTFFHEDSGLYTALGHVVSEGSSPTPLAMDEGQIVRATVMGIQPSKKGEPGEVLGTFVEGTDVIGSIRQNGNFGISGVLIQDLTNPFYPSPIPLGLESQLEVGEAEILTTLDGNRIQKFSAYIEQVFTKGASSKGFVVRITDERLLQTTGGIVQGMSGSPVIQNGMLVGAVTHVLVHDPQRGYGTFAERMAREAHLPEMASGF